MAKKKPSRELPPAPRKRRPKFVMSPPNDDIDEYGWALKNVRLPTEEKNIAGRPAFTIKTKVGEVKRYGVDIQFLHPTYIERALDECEQVSAAIEKAKAAGWTPEALKALNAAIVKAFNDKVLVDIVAQFYNVAPLVAQFYAARQAYWDMYGREENDDDDES